MHAEKSTKITIFIPKTAKQ